MYLKKGCDFFWVEKLQISVPAGRRFWASVPSAKKRCGVHCRGGLGFLFRPFFQYSSSELHLWQSSTVHGHLLYSALNSSKTTFEIFSPPVQLLQFLSLTQVLVEGELFHLAPKKYFLQTCESSFFRIVLVVKPWDLRHHGSDLKTFVTKVSKKGYQKAFKTFPK